MLIDTFIENSLLANNSTKIIDRTDFINMKSEILERFDYIYLPSLKIFRKVDISEEGINKAILEANYGIAETGTVICISHAENLRRATMLVQHLTFVLNKRNILNSLEDASKVLDSETKNKSNYISFITGPSRTADIENQLIIGVHGPLSQEILILD
jgi:L-lactate dehydrogenase complex protein LldG